MGREWFYWGGGGAAAARSSSAASASKKGKRSRKQLEVDDGSAPSPGCMCAVLQLFDLPHFQVVLNHHSHRSLSPVSSFVQDHSFERTTGLEAPRNSLDMEEPRVGLNPASKTMLPRLKQEEEEEAKNLNNISVGINQIRTSCDSRPSSSKPRSDDFSSECSSSPGGAKTPNLVARLMGLDLLPENASPTFGNSRKSNLQPRTEPRDRARYLLHHDRRSRSFNVLDNADISGGAGGTVSLPETPRISLARKSDVDHHHRLSLQINKENVGEEFDHFSSGKRSARSRRREPREALRQVDENIRSPSFYARQIVKQVKESVSRKVGADITNNTTTVKNNLKHHNNLDNNQVVLLKPSKPSIFLPDDFSPTKNQSCSPRFRFLEPKTAKLPPSNADNLNPPPQQQPKKVVPKPKSQENKNNVKKPAAIRSKKEEPFVRPANTNHESKKGKRATPLSSELLNPNNVPTILPALKKDCNRPSSSSPPKLPQKQAHDDDALSSKRGSSQLSSSPSQSYHPPTTSKDIIVRDRNGAAPSGQEQVAEFQYIQRILKRTGIEKDSSVSLAKWYSSSHPLDPSIFHYIELFHHHPAIKNSKLRLRCNRKLVFQLVDELLVGILKPYLGSPVGFGRHVKGSELLETLCSKVGSFPSADCQVLEDIDALIETDMEKSRNGAFEQGEEEESVVLEIERHVVDELMHETAMVVLEGVPRPYGERRERERERASQVLTSERRSHGSSPRD